MNKEYLNVILADDDEGNLILFKSILQDLKIHIKVKTFCNITDTMEYLNSDDAVIPEVFFMNFNTSGKNCITYLSELKADNRFDHMTTVIYAQSISSEDEEEIFVNGANVLMKKPDNYRDMKKNVTDIMTVTWQYHTSGLNKNNFIMKV